MRLNIQKLKVTKMRRSSSTCKLLGSDVRDIAGAGGQGMEVNAIRKKL